MNRIIKFRIWDGKKMIEPGVIDFDREQSMDYYNWYDGYAGDYLPFQYHPLMQFTGLPDKYEKESYEGDRIRIEQGECTGHDGEGNEVWIPVEGKISFEDGMFVFDGHSCGTLPLYAYKDSFEVIGNIYETPELLNK